jgi:hypothetical protein
MRLVIVAVLCGTGCQPEPLDFPPLPGGGGGIGGGGTDGGAQLDGSLDDGDVGAINGRVCVVLDLRNLGTCDDDGVLGTTVSLGDSTALTDDTGAFTIETPTGTDLVWSVTGLDLVPSVIEFGTAFELPAIRTNDYADLLSDNGILLTAGQGSVVAQVTSTSVPVSGATVASSPQAQFTTRYDGNSALVWDEDATGPRGVAWLAGITPAIATTLIVSPPIGADVTVTAPVEADSITFAKIAL